MLKPPSPEIAECYARAMQARERANITQNAEMRTILADAERRWLRLAASYEKIARFNQFVGREPIVKHPNCKSCGVAMWLVRTRRLSTDRMQYIYECKACGGGAEVEGNSQVC